MSLNPFDWNGPSFLVFYLALLGVVILGIWLIRGIKESGSILPEVLADPYLIAGLESRRHVIQVTVLSLIERGLITVEGNHLFLVASKQEFARRPVEKNILTALGNGNSQISELMLDYEVNKSVQQMESWLEKEGLRGSTGSKTLRIVLMVIGLCILWKVASIKIDIAIARGHYNVMFLELLRALGVMGIVALTFRNWSQTLLGKKVQKEVRERLRGLHERSEKIPLDGATNELAFLAGAFGLAALPLTALKWRDAVTAHFLSRSGDSNSGSCGGGSCGGSGGGCGGCGGGCGGCG